MYTVTIIDELTKKLINKIKFNDFMSTNELTKIGQLLECAAIRITRWYKFILDGAMQYERNVYVTQEA